MPMKMTGGDEGLDSLYASGENESKAPQDKKSVDQEEAEDDATALVPLKILQKDSSDMVKVGDERVMEVVAVHGDEAEVKYSKTKPGEIGGGGEGQSASDEIDSMDNKSENY